MDADRQLELLRQCVALRLQAREVRESVRVGLASIEQSLAVLAGPLVRKTVTAKLLGVSVQAIDRHVAAGRIPTEPIGEGSNRRAIPRETVVDVAYEQQLSAGGSLAAAIAAVDRRRWREREFRELGDLIAVGARWSRLMLEREAR